jgi:hypothetical protein
MAEIIQYQDPQEFSSNITGIGPRLPSHKEKHGSLRRTNGKDIRKSTGPRTAQGKKRSKLNELKHGLFSKGILLGGESRAEYASLLSGLREDLQPQGKLESVLVEYLVVLLWRKRRALQSEISVISENIASTAPDSAWEQYGEAWVASRDAIASGGLLKYSNNVFVLREAIEILTSFRCLVEAFGFREDCYALKKLYGQNQDGGTPHGLRLRYENFATELRLFKEIGAPSKEAEYRKEMVGLIDDEIEHLTRMKKRLKAFQEERAQYQTSAAVIPGQEVSDRLIRYEAHLSREIDRILNRLERLQRMRKGQLLPPQLEVNIS